MGKASFSKSSGKGKGAGKWNTGKGASSTAHQLSYTKKVEWGNRISKWFLRPYTTASCGSGLAVPANTTSKDFLRAQCAHRLCSTQYWAKNVLSEESSEYCRRPGVAVSEASSNFEAGAKLLKAHFGKEKDCSCIA
eukprot:6469781-Amphidinium_carterae.2